MHIEWLETFAEKWRDSIAQGRMPHAVLLTGPPGVGKRAAADWMARTRLGTAGAVPVFPFRPLEHADLRWIAPFEDKSTIGIEQIRELVSDIGLTSYAGRGKVAVIEPAQLMTSNAANSLLKTLEEPPGDALLILVADRAGALPATIYSRCQRMDIRAPDASLGLAWLDRLQPGTAWAQALELAGNAPIAAIEALEQLDLHAAMRRDLGAVASGSASPLDVAGRWAKIDPPFVLTWLSRQVQAAISAASGAPEIPVAGAIGETVLKRMDRRNLFCYLDTINRLRGQPAGSYNVQLTFESLLIDWANGLANEVDT
jgi:DNA polymerase-3 subunit delta'